MGGGSCRLGAIKAELAGVSCPGLLLLLGWFGQLLDLAVGRGV